jgi:hypothetical protein
MGRRYSGRVPRPFRRVLKRATAHAGTAGKSGRRRRVPHGSGNGPQVLRPCAQALPKGLEACHGPCRDCGESGRRRRVPRKRQWAAGTQAVCDQAGSEGLEQWTRRSRDDRVAGPKRQGSTWNRGDSRDPRQGLGAELRGASKRGRRMQDQEESEPGTGLVRGRASRSPGLLAPISRGSPRLVSWSAHPELDDGGTGGRCQRTAAGGAVRCASPRTGRVVGSTAASLGPGGRGTGGARRLAEWSRSRVGNAHPPRFHARGIELRG